MSNFFFSYTKYIFARRVRTVHTSLSNDVQKANLRGSLWTAASTVFGYRPTRIILCPLEF